MIELEARIRRLEDIEAIRNLKALYCSLVDGAVAGDASKAVELAGFCVQGSWADFGDFGRFEGQEGLLLFFRDVVPGILSYSAHMVHNPVIAVEGDSARGEWVFEVPSTLRANDMAGWLQGRYVEEYVRTAQGWRFKSITAVFDYATPFDEGWAKRKMFSL